MKNYTMRLFKLLLLLVVSINGFTQYKNVLSESFNNNKNKWFEEKEGDLVANIRKGEYYTKYSGMGMASCVTSLKKLSHNNDYIISTKLKQLSGDANQGYGLVIGQKDLKNFYAFTIAREGQAAIYEFYKGKYYPIESWKKTEIAPNSLNEWNELSIHKKQGEWLFLLNGNVVHKTIAREFYGEGIGVLMNTSMELVVDSLVVQQKEIESPKVSIKKILESPIIFSSQYDSETQGMVNEKSKKSFVRKGQLILENKLSGRPAFFESGMTNFSGDFAINVNLGQLSGSATSGYGILLGNHNKGGGFGFLISPQKKIYFYGKYKQSLITLRKWTLESMVQGMPKANDVWFIQKGGRWFFYLNGRKIFETFARKISNKELRFILNSNMKVAVNSVKVYGENKLEKINAIEIEGEKQKLTNTINTVYDEIAPIVSVDGEQLCFFRNNHPQNIGDEKKQDAWNSLFVNGEWAAPTNYAYPINNDNDNFIISVSPDKNTMLVSGHYKKDGSSISDGISITEFINGKWTLPKAIQIEDWYNYSVYQGFQLASDNKTLLISADRADSKGGADIYYSLRKNDSTWSKPVSLGAVINTEGNEYTPFLAADGQTLYFSSTGHPGYGSLDIFMSKKKDSWTSWTTPVNMGKKVNSKEWDAYLTVSASGDKMYFTSYSEDGVDADLYQIEVKEKEVKPEPVLLIKGKVLNSFDSSFVGTTLSIRDLETDEELAVARSNSVDGEYTIVLPAKNNYAFYAEEKGYYSVRQNVRLDSLVSYDEVTQDLLLTPFRVGEKIRLNNIFFIRGRAELTKNSYSELGSLVELLKENMEMKIEIGGHTDNVGKPHLNVKLSEDRAKAIKKYLVSQGISAKRLKTKGYGGSVPIANNKYEYTRKLNRRVEFIILND